MLRAVRAADNKSAKRGMHQFQQEMQELIDRAQGLERGLLEAVSNWFRFSPGSASAKMVMLKVTESTVLYGAPPESDEAAKGKKRKKDDDEYDLEGGGGPGPSSKQGKGDSSSRKTAAVKKTKNTGGGGQKTSTRVKAQKARIAQEPWDLMEILGAVLDPDPDLADTAGS